jgi:hypothetical protein
MIRSPRITVTCSGCGAVGVVLTPITEPGAYATQCASCLAWLSFTVPSSLFEIQEPAWYRAINRPWRLPRERRWPRWHIEPRWILAACWAVVCVALIGWAWR